MCPLPLPALCWLSALFSTLSLVWVAMCPLPFACPLLAHCMPFPFASSTPCLLFALCLPLSCLLFTFAPSTVCSLPAFACSLHGLTASVCLVGVLFACICLPSAIICLPLSVQWVCMTSAYIRLTVRLPLQMFLDEDVDPNGPCQQYTKANDVLRDLKSNLSVLWVCVTLIAFA